jgi:hypothetical protein
MKKNYASQGKRGSAVSVPSVALEFHNRTEKPHHPTCGFPNPISHLEPATNPSSKKVPKVPTPQLSA